VDTGFYKLPYAALVFYRRFLPHNNFQSIPINLENISAELNYWDRNETNLPKTAEQSILEPLKAFCLISSYVKEEGLGDQEEHVPGLQILEGLAFFENGEIAKMGVHAIYDFIQGKTAQAIVYSIFTFEHGSTIAVRSQRLVVADQSKNLSAKTIGELIKGTGRFEGIMGTVLRLVRISYQVKERLESY
jgi:hypothetical protein